MATTRENSLSMEQRIKAALLEQTKDRFDLVPKLTAKINSIFADKLFSDELDELERSIQVLLMHGGTKDGRQKRASIQQLDAAFATLEDPGLMVLLRTKPTKMWKELIIEKIVGRMLDLEKQPNPTYQRN